MFSAIFVLVLHLGIPELSSGAGARRGRERQALRIALTVLAAVLVGSHAKEPNHTFTLPHDDRAVQTFEKPHALNFRHRSVNFHTHIYSATLSHDKGEWVAAFFTGDIRQHAHPDLFAGLEKARCRFPVHLPGRGMIPHNATRFNATHITQQYYGSTTVWTCAVPAAISAHMRRMRVPAHGRRCVAVTLSGIEGGTRVGPVTACTEVPVGGAVKRKHKLAHCMSPLWNTINQWHLIPQYIEYHKRVGVEHFYFYILYPGSSLGGGLPVLLPYILSGQVTVRRFDTGWTAAMYSERQTDFTPAGEVHNPGQANFPYKLQGLAATDCLWRLRGTTEWAAVNVDLDEWFSPIWPAIGAKNVKNHRAGQECWTAGKCEEDGAAPCPWCDLQDAGNWYCCSTTKSDTHNTSDACSQVEYPPLSDDQHRCRHAEADCSGHGKVDYKGACTCDHHWEGNKCEKKCEKDKQCGTKGVAQGRGRKVQGADDRAEEREPRPEHLLPRLDKAMHDGIIQIMVHRWIAHMPDTHLDSPQMVDVQEIDSTHSDEWTKSIVRPEKVNTMWVHAISNPFHTDRQGMDMCLGACASHKVHNDPSAWGGLELAFLHFSNGYWHGRADLPRHMPDFIHGENHSIVKWTFSPHLKGKLNAAIEASLLAVGGPDRERP